MVVAYVRLQPRPAGRARVRPRVHALLLPDAELPHAWRELEVRSSALHGSGIFPARSSSAGGDSFVDWATVGPVPIVLPYFGFETVVDDRHTVDMLVKVLKGDFQLVTVSEVQTKHGLQALVADGLFAVRKDAVGQGSKLPSNVELLQMRWSSTSSSSCCYMLADDVRVALNLTGER